MAPRTLRSENTSLLRIYSIVCPRPAVVRARINALRLLLLTGGAIRICSRRFFARALIVGFNLLFLTGGITSAATAQTVTATTGAVNGIVTDSSQAVVPGVTVTLSGPALITPRTTLTDDTGAYRFSAVPPGDHTLTFDLAGFGTIVREGIQIGLGFTATVNVEMSPGNITR